MPCASSSLCRGPAGAAGSLVAAAQAVSCAPSGNSGHLCLYKLCCMAPAASFLPRAPWGPPPRECATGGYPWGGGTAGSDKHLTFDMILPCTPSGPGLFNPTCSVCGSSSPHIFASVFQIWGAPDVKSNMAIVKNFKIWEIYKEKTTKGIHHSKIIPLHMFFKLLTLK